MKLRKEIFISFAEVQDFPEGTSINDYRIKKMAEAGFTNDMEIACEKNFKLNGILYYQCGIIRGPYKKTIPGKRKLCLSNT